MGDEREWVEPLNNGFISAPELGALVETVTSVLIDQMREDRERYGHDLNHNYYPDVTKAFLKACNSRFVRVEILEEPLAATREERNRREETYDRECLDNLLRSKTRSGRWRYYRREGEQVREWYQDERGRWEWRWIAQMPDGTERAFHAPREVERDNYDLNKGEYEAKRKEAEGGATEESA
jgi:hypothetical protein